LAKKNGNKDEKDAAAEGQRIPLESGVVLPPYRLPTETEWEYAAKALVGTQYLDEMQDYARLYPWDGHSLRNPYGKQMGQFLANFRRGRGDYAGIAGRLNDGAMITEWIYAFPPNDYGLYNMAGNVNEWVEDIYRPLNHATVNGLNPVRTDGMYLTDSTAKKANPRRIKNPDEGRDAAILDPANGATTGFDQVRSDNPGGSSLIGNNARVYKGGSWADGAYWLAPGTRRFLEQDSSTSTIGFRCAMIRAGTNH
jgi:formylglycine-generating enzyme